MIRVRTKNISKYNKSRRGFIKGFACFCLNEYRNLIVECLTGQKRSWNSFDCYVKLDDGKKISLRNLLSALDVDINYRQCCFHINMKKNEYIEGKSADCIFRSIMFSFVNKAQAAAFQKAEIKYAESYKRMRNKFIRARLNGVI